MFSYPELWASRLLFVGLVIESIELFSLRHAFEDTGIFSRANIMILLGQGAKRPIWARDDIPNAGLLVAAIALQGVAAAWVMAAGYQNVAGKVAVLFCLLANGFLRTRKQIGGSGAEQLTFIVLVTFGLVYVAGDTPVARQMGDAFIAAQVLLAYFASGVAKLVSPVWRNGWAMTRVLSTEGYGLMPLARFLTRHPRFDLLMCWAVMLWEVAFPVVLFTPPTIALIFFISGVVFHLSCAVFMGLNRFVWAFCGCYPAIWATLLLLQAHMKPII